ncbi:Hsp20/alpha crystallin family protein [Tenacibaculum sp. MEBiC06402]|uniref:Hsp20/alpha crystallin family protein n=1 Tax=unclassified Tenacibaculum TaxID=2635139 RepID=UPI003B9D3C66
MSNLATLSKNGSLANAKTNYPKRSTLFDDFFMSGFPSIFSSDLTTETSVPKVNIKETNDSFIVEMAVPGMKKSDFDVSVDNNLLSISSIVEYNNEETSENYTRKEFSYSSFERRFKLPETVDDEKIKANYTDGILEVILPKREEAKKKPIKTIKIS